jgi:uncharacterized membrane protein YcaP (DUF421 family)
MKKDDIQPWDLYRIMFGEAPAGFLVEVFVRTSIIFLLLLVVLRLLGKRMDGQLTLTEMSVIITLGAIVSVPMQIPDRGILVGFIALLCAVAFQRGLTWLTVKNKKIEAASQGVVSILVKDGVLQLKEMAQASMSKQHVFSALRQKQIFNLGRVQRLYFEACGLMNIYEEKDKKAGLPVFPSDEEKLVQSRLEVDSEHFACANCGNVVSKNHRLNVCDVCGEKKWMEAVF